MGLIKKSHNNFFLFIGQTCVYNANAILLEDIVVGKIKLVRFKKPKADAKSKKMSEIQKFSSAIMRQVSMCKSGGKLRPFYRSCYRSWRPTLSALTDANQAW